MTTFNFPVESAPGAFEASLGAGVAGIGEATKALRRIATALSGSGDGGTAPSYDQATGRYVELGDWLDARCNGKRYGVQIPKFSYTTDTKCVKTLANSGLFVTPSTASLAGRDDYRSEFPFMHWDVNGGVDPDGTLYVTTMRDYAGDAGFSPYGDKGNVFSLVPTLYWSLTDQGKFLELVISDTPYDDLEPMPGAKMPDGTIRPFAMLAKYAGGTYGGKYASVSGVATRTRDVSHDSVITLARSVGAAYSGKSLADDWYVKAMFLLKYATKDTQSVFAGCSNYNLQYAVTVAQTSAKSVIIATSNAANLVVGSTVCVDTGDRSGSVCTNARIVGISTHDSNNSRVDLDVASGFTTTTSHKLSTMPWHTGCLDRVQGSDGTITAEGAANGKEPFCLQGIECMMGAWEVLAPVMLYSGTPGVDVYVNYDSANEATAYSSSVYADTGVDLPVQASAGWLYCGDLANAGGLLAPQAAGATSSTGLCDGHYQSGSGSNGWREFLGVGRLDNGAGAGLWADHSNAGLSPAYWGIASRLSVMGRTAA